MQKETGAAVTAPPSETIPAFSIPDPRPIETVLARLQKVRKGRRGWTARCPAHHDHNPSLSVAEAEDGRVLLYCHAGCSLDSILTAIGLKPQDLFPAPRLVACYDYVDATGNLLFQVLRYEPKAFRQRRPDGKGGWIYNLAGVEPVLYHLPEVLLAARDGKRVFVVEGEKDADNLRAQGLVATCNPMGAGKWRGSYSQALRGARVVIIPDKDAPGRQHAEQVAKSLHGVAASVKVLELPGDGKDVSDWLAAGGTREQLLALADKTPEWRQNPLPQTFTAAELIATEFPEPRWVAEGILPEGLTILGGKPKMGKSWLMLDLAVAATSGGYVLGKKPVTQCGVLYLALEDTPRRLKSRLVSLLNGSPAPPGLHLHTEWPPLDKGGLTALENWLTEHSDVRLVIIDTLQKIRPSQAPNRSLYEQDYAVISELKNLAEQRGLSIIVVHHLRKAEAEDPLEQLSGTTGLSGAADTIWILKRDRARADATLFVTGRDVDEQELALKFDAQTGSWTLLGPAEDYRRSQERQQVLDVLRQASQPLSPKEISDVLGAKGGNVRFLLSQLLKEGAVKQVRYGKYIATNTANSTNSTNTTNNANTQTVIAAHVGSRPPEMPVQTAFGATVSGVSDGALTLTTPEMPTGSGSQGSVSGVSGVSGHSNLCVFEGAAEVAVAGDDDESPF